MKYFLLTTWVTLVALLPLQAQWGPGQSEELEELICKEQARAALHVEGRGYRNAASHLSDMHYQEMRWDIDPAVYFIHGTITYQFESRTDALGELLLDLSDALTVLRVERNGEPLTWTHGSDQLLRIDLGKVLGPGEYDTLLVEYEGMPPSNGFGSFEQATHGGAPIIWTLSEPYGMRDWWPGKQDLADKIDSIDVYITTPAGQLAASNGKLMSITQDGDRLVHHWRHRHPIAAYLVALAVTNYEAYSHFLPLDETDTLEILNYVFPENRAQAETQTPRTLEIMALYNDLFGRYPFADEKYGHAQFGWGGGMEHQTMSFMYNFSHELVAHELAHQWFGDKVTCNSWTEIWMNEGFATYLTGLTYEAFSPDTYWPAWKKNVVNTATSQPGGSVWVNDTTSVNRIFSGRLSYNKGAYLLQMLRWIVGDEDFFGACRDYLELPGTAYEFGSTAEFQYYLEQRSGLDLEEFFRDWFYGEGWPSYAIRWTQTPDSLILWADQAQSHPSVDFFEMPIPVKVFSAGNEATLRLDHSANGQRFSAALSAPVDSIQFDPDLWLLSRNNTITEITTAIGAPEDETRILVYPNPAIDWLECYPAEGITHLRITDAMGRIALLPLEHGRADISSLPSGVYAVWPCSGGRQAGPNVKVSILR